MRLLIVAICSIFMMLGCSSTPVSPTGLAVYDTLEADAQLRTWVAACQTINKELHDYANATRQAWWQRNGSYVESADFGLNYGVLRVSEERVEAGARLAMGLTWNIVQQSELDRDQHLSEKACYSMLSKYEQGKFDFGKKSKWYNELTQLQRFKENSSEDFTHKLAAVTTATGIEYGRSFYVVEKLIKQEECDTAEVRLIKNSWPNEVYEANCADKSYHVVRCEWSNCRILY